MRVKMLTTITGTRDGVDWPQRGETIDLPADEAAQMLAAGLVEPDDAPVIETATTPTRRSRG